MRQSIVAKAAFWLLIVAIVIFSIFPFYYAIISSFRSGSALVLHLDPAGRLRQREATSRCSSASLSRATSPTRCSSRSRGGGGGGALALPGRDRGPTRSGASASGGGVCSLITILSVSMFPQVAGSQGMFELVRALGIYNSLWSLILSNMTPDPAPHGVGAHDLHARIAQGAGGGGLRRRRLPLGRREQDLLGP